MLYTVESIMNTFGTCCVCPIIMEVKCTMLLWDLPGFHYMEYYVGSFETLLGVLSIIIEKREERFH